MILGKILERLDHGGIISFQDLARESGVGEEALSAAVERLARLGYVRPAFPGCGETCGGCRGSRLLRGGCADGMIGGPLASANHAWALTERGREYARRRKGDGS